MCFCQHSEDLWELQVVAACFVSSVVKMQMIGCTLCQHGDLEAEEAAVGQAFTTRFGETRINCIILSYVAHHDRFFFLLSFVEM